MLYIKYFTSVYGIITRVNISKKIGENLKSARKQAGYTQTQVAKKMFMTQQQYSRFENGVFQLNYEQILKLCELFDVTPNYIFGYGD